MKNKRLFGFVLAAVALLLIPLTAMQLTDEVNWTRKDFGFMGFLLVSTAVICEFVLRTVRRIELRIAICSLILAAFVFIWIELAVGIFGTMFAGK